VSRFRSDCAGAGIAWLLLAGGAPSIMAETAMAQADKPRAAMADQSHRENVVGIDVVTYPTSVKDVVVVLGALPAGDAMAQSGNIAIPTLVGMMLDRGTKALDKFAISDRLDNVGAQISFAVGTQSLEIHGKSLKKDLPLIIGLMAAELRTPAFSSQEFTKAKQQFIGSLEASCKAPRAVRRKLSAVRCFPRGIPIGRTPPPNTSRPPRPQRWIRSKRFMRSITDPRTSPWCWSAM